MKKRVVAVFLAVLMGMSVTACSGQEEIQEVNSVSVSGILPETGDVIVTNTYIGTVAPQESITVYPMKSGNITEISAAVGKQVKAGEVLFKIDSSEAEMEIAAAEEDLEKAEEAAEQAKKDAEALAEAEKEADLADMKAEVDALKKKYDDAKAEYDDLYSDYRKNYKEWSTDVRDAKQETIALAKERADEAKEAYEEANKEYTAASKKNTTGKTSVSKDKDSEDEDGKTTDNAASIYDQMVEDAEQAVEDAKAKLELYQVTAPIEGIVEAVLVEKNEKAFEDAPCLIISNKSNMEVTFQVAEAAALELKAGDKVKVEKNGAMNEATITEVAIMADEQTKLFTVKASLGAVAGFSTGTDVKVYAETQKALGVMKLPYDTLYFQGETAYVYCAVDDEAVRRPVQVGLMNEEYAQILDGLTAEDIVISTWSSQLKDGADIDLLFVIGGDTVEGITDDAANESTDENLDEITNDSSDQSTDDTETENSDDTEEEYKWVLPELD